MSMKYDISTPVEMSLINDGFMDDMTNMTMLTGSHAHLALTHPSFVPPPRPKQFLDGATAWLRSDMARFSSGEDHRKKRESFLELVATIDVREVGRVARSIMRERLTGTSVDVYQAGWEVPSYTMAAVLGLGVEPEAVRADTETVARVIGRNEPSTGAADAAASRLLAACAIHPDPVAAVSMLYQNHDATAGLIHATASTAADGKQPIAVGRTVRVLTETVELGDLVLEEGDAVAVDLEGMPFGTGIHECPGADLANAICDGVFEALAAGRYEMVSERLAERST